MPLRLVVPPAAPPDPRVSRFRARLDQQYAALSMPPPAQVTDLAAVLSHPELLLYFASTAWDAAADPTFSADLDAYARDAHHLLPVIRTAHEATSHLAACLRRFNAFIEDRFPDVVDEALVDEVLTLLWQRRRQRRIFISYRRAESLAVARQLADHYGERSFDVFLDERSIDPGDDFQDELKRRLHDSDVVLLLVTPGLGTSKWVREEIAFAQAHRIGVLGVVWPGSGAGAPGGSATVAELMPDQQFRLPATTLAAHDRVLATAELSEVDRMLFLGRSVTVARRITGMIDDVERMVSDFQVGARRDDGDLDLTRLGEAWRGRVTPFRPTPNDVFRWQEELAAGPARPDGLIVLYPQLDPDSLSERALRTFIDAWGPSVYPRVEVRGVTW